MEYIGKKLWNVLESVLRFIIYSVFRLNLLPEKWEGLIQFAKFGIVGLSNTVVSYVVYLIAFLFLNKIKVFPHTDYLIAQFLGFLLSVLWSFILNRKYVFSEGQQSVSWVKALLKTYVSYAFTGLFLNSILSVLWVEWIGISKLIAPIFNLIISVPINFILNKFWAFKGK